jgi:hypothetical protein
MGLCPYYAQNQTPWLKHILPIRARQEWSALGRCSLSCANRPPRWSKRSQTRATPSPPPSAQKASIANRVLTLALDDAAFGWVDRYALGVWMRWKGGGESRRELLSRKGKTIGWTAEENDALRRYFATLTHEALQQMMPGRSMSAIKQQASRLGLSRPRSGRRDAISPVIFSAPNVGNTMARYGFPLRSQSRVLESASA